MFKLSKKCAMRQAQVPDFAGAYSSLGGTMLSYLWDTLSEYHSVRLNSAGKQTLNTTQRYHSLNLGRSCIQNAHSHTGELYPQSGGSSE